MAKGFNPQFDGLMKQAQEIQKQMAQVQEDTPVAELSVICNSTNVTVHGQELHFFYTVGEVTETVLVQLSDGRSLVDANLFVTVEERNDAPIVHPMALQIFIVEELRTIDLSPFVEDEETPIQDLTITFDSPDVFDIEGMSVTFQFRTPSSNQSIYFNVSDGFLVAEGRIQVRVESAPAPSGDERNMLLPVLVIGIIMITSIALLATVEISKVALIGLLLPLYMKLSSIDILDQFTRGKIYGYILANPGVHYNSIKRTLDIPNGSFVYHLNLLQNEGYIKFQHDGIYKRYYPSDMKIPKQEFSLNESQTLIMKIVSRSPGISQKKIASIMGVSSAAVHFQVEELINLGFIRKERRGMSVGYFIQLSG